MDAPHLLWGLACTLSPQGLKLPTYKMGLSGAALGRRERGALEPPQHSGMAGVPPEKNSQAGKAATEAVTRLLMPRVLRAPRRRPQVKARNWGWGWGWGHRSLWEKETPTPRTGTGPRWALDCSRVNPLAWGEAYVGVGAG